MVTGPQFHKTELRFGLALYTASLDCTPGRSAVAGHRQLLPDTFPKETEKEKTSLQDLMKKNGEGEQDGQRAEKERSSSVCFVRMSGTQSYTQFLNITKLCAQPPLEINEYENHESQSSLLSLLSRTCSSSSPCSRSGSSS